MFSIILTSSDLPWSYRKSGVSFLSSRIVREKPSPVYEPVSCFLHPHQHASTILFRIRRNWRSSRSFALRPPSLLWPLLSAAAPMKANAADAQFFLATHSCSSSFLNDNCVSTAGAMSMLIGKLIFSSGCSYFSVSAGPCAVKPQVNNHIYATGVVGLDTLV